jgi:hypothetical protein
MTKRIRFMACAAMCLMARGASADMLIAGGSAFFNQSDRFYGGTNPPPDFAFSQFNFSAVGNAHGTDGSSFWGTLISPNFILTANHSGGQPPTGTTFTFSTTDSRTGPTVSFTAGPGMEVGNTDLFLMELTKSTAGSGLVPYAIAADDESSLVGAKTYGVGRPWRIGTNNIDGFATAGVDFTSPSPPEGGRTFLYDYNNSNPTGNPFENELQSGDSGGPTFVANGNQLLLVGIHWFNFNPGDASYTPFGGSGDSFVPANIAMIEATMKLIDPTTTDTLTVIPFSVPEPSALALTAVGLLGLFARRLRSLRARTG